MALSENLKNKHAEQVAFAKKQFEAYKDWIVNEFVNEFGGSYQRPEDVKDTWRQTFQYAPECENFLEFKTRIFIRMLPTKEGISNTPVFLKNFVRLVSEYLSVYINKKNPEKNRNVCANELYERLYSAYANRVVDKYNKQKDREWGLQLKARREAKETKKQKHLRKGKRKRICPIRIEMEEEQLDKLESKSVRARIRLKKEEIAQLKISIEAVKRK